MANGLARLPGLGSPEIIWVRLFWSEPKALLMPAFEVAG